MDSDIRNLKIAFQLAVPEDIIDALIKNVDFCARNNERYIDFSGMSEAYYNMTFRKLLTGYSMDEIRNMYYEMKSSYESKEDIPTGVFQLLVNYDMNIFEYCDEVPVVKRSKLMDFRQISLELGQDIFTVSYLAYMAFRKNIPEQVKFDWNKVVYTNDRRLQNILNTGIAENHFHLAGSAPVFFLSWIALMNNPHMIGKFFDSLYQSDDPFIENRNRSISFSNNTHQLNWSRSLRLAAWIRSLFFQKIYHISSETKWNFDALDLDFSRLTGLSSKIMKLKQLYGEKFLQPDGSLKCLDYAIIKNNYFFDHTSENRLFYGERQFMYKCFTACFRQEFSFEEQNLFYLYLLLKNRFRSELIQVNHETGFANFFIYQYRKAIFWGNIDEYWIESQRMTVNSQFGKGHLKSLEIRLSPPDTSEKIYRNIIMEDNNILFSDDNGIFKNSGYIPDPAENTRPFWTDWNIWSGLDDGKKAAVGGKLPFFYVFHFIKNQMKKPEKSRFSENTAPRNNDVRTSAKKFAHELAKALEQSEYLCSRIRGVDASSFEIACRPETFATEFRFLKNFVPQCRSMNILTSKKRILPKLGISYHVGEDFLDIADGLRAIDETFSFLNLSRGDRIGHAIALGVSPKIHYDLKGNTIILPKQDILDNFIWLIHRSTEFGVKIDFNLCDDLKRICENLLYQIYGKCMKRNGLDLNIHDYYNSWKLRGDHPYCYRSLKYQPPDNQKRFLSLNSIDEKYNSCLINGNTYDHFRYHENIAAIMHYYHYGYDERIEGMKPYKWKISYQYIKLISDMQKCMQELTAENGIAIECNLSSNHLIGTFGTYDQHPIFRFNMHLLSQNEDRQHICVSINTDDQGVFDTSLENEYALLAECISNIRHENNERVYNDEIIYQYIDYIRRLGLEQAFKSPY